MVLRDNWWIYFHSEIGESSLSRLGRTEARRQWVKKKMVKVQSWSERQQQLRGMWSTLHEDGNHLNVPVKCQRQRTPRRSEGRGFE